jgi:hypothetical protein
MNEAFKTRILGRAIILAAMLPILWFILTTLDGYSELIAAYGLLIVVAILIIVVEKIAKRKTRPPPSEIEKY